MRDQSPSVTSRNHSHAAILHCRVVNRQPKRHDIHWLESPVSCVLMPWKRQSISLSFTDNMTCEEHDIRTDELLNYVEYSLVRAEFEQVSVACVGHVNILLPSS